MGPIKHQPTQLNRKCVNYFYDDMNKPAIKTNEITQKKLEKKKNILFEVPI